MGAHVDQPFISNNSKLIIDYANSGWRTEKLDIFLSVKCLFFISSSTGLDAVRFAIRKPVVTVNLAQPLTFIKYKADHLFIFKKFFYQKENTFLSIRKYYELGIESGFTVDNPFHLRDQDLIKLEVDVIDNTSFEILDATVEMYASLTNKKSRINKLNKLNQIKYYIGKEITMLRRNLIVKALIKMKINL
jgi:putative glycosyltransferase (TIGR04372 family)